MYFILFFFDHFYFMITFNLQLYYSQLLHVSLVASPMWPIGNQEMLSTSTFMVEMSYNNIIWFGKTN